MAAAAALRFERYQVVLPRSLRRARRVSYDEIAEVAAEDGSAVITLHGGTRVRVAGAAAEADRLRCLLEGPRAEGGLAELRATAKELFAAAPAGFHAPAAADFLLAAASRLRASDLHLSPAKDLSTTARLRVDGVLHDLCAIPADAAVRVVARLKVLGGAASYRSDVPQEGRFQRSGVDYRCAFVPVAGGERASVRLLGEGRARLSFDELGMDADAVALARRLLRRPHGLVLVCGAPGAGKTTTLYAALDEIARERGGLASLVSIEDPVERRIEGVDQVELEPRRGPSAAEVLAALLRQDADVLLLGEVRDARAAEVMLEAAFTGHLVLAGLHCGQAAEAHARLLDLGADARLLGSALAGVLHQRLLRRACATCATRGCEVCLGTGYSGRFAVAEGYEASPAVRAAVAARAPFDEMSLVLAKEGFVPGRRRADARARAGETRSAEVERVFGGGPP